MELAQYDSDMKVGIASSDSELWEILSIYPSDDKAYVWFDIQARDEDRQSDLPF